MKRPCRHLVSSQKWCAGSPDDGPDEPHYPRGAGVYGFGRNKEGQLGLGPAMQVRGTSCGHAKTAAGRCVRSVDLTGSDGCVRSR